MISLNNITTASTTPSSVQSAVTSSGGVPVIRKSNQGSIEQGLQKATQQQQEYLNEAKTLYEPYTKAGVQSLDEYMKLLMGGIDSLATDTNYLSMKNAATRDVMANRATSGLLRSGATASALEDTLLKFANNYYGNRLGQLQQGIQYGQYGTTGESSILEKLGVSGTDLAGALANIQMQREANEAVIKAAELEAEAAKKAAKKSGKSSLWGSIGSVGGGIIGGVFGGPAGAYVGSQVGGSLGSSLGQ